MKKINIAFFITIVGIVMLSIFDLMRPHYASDAYNVVKLGLLPYAIKWFLPAGRIVGVITLFILEKLNFNYIQYISVMQWVSLIIASLTIYILYKVLINISKPTTMYQRILTLLVATITIINNGSYQYFYFPESGIMWMSVLFTVLAIKTIAEEKQHQYLKTFVYLLLSINCYQGSTLFFIPAIVLIIFYKNKCDFKKSIIKIVKLGLMLIICLLINYIFLMIIQNVYNIPIARKTDININIGTFFKKLIIMLYGYNDNFPMVIKTQYIFFFIAMIGIVKEKYYKYDRIKSYLILILMTFASIIPVIMLVSTLNFYIGDRIIYSYTSIIGFSYIFLLLYLNTNTLPKIGKTCIILGSIIVLTVTILNFRDLTKWHFIVNEKDKELTLHIGKRIDDYEEKSQNKIRKIMYCYDSKRQHCYNDVRRTDEATVRAIGGSWCIDGIIYVYTGKDIEVIENQDIHETIFNNKEWEDFSDEQIKFEDDIMYYCIY